nr:ATP-binding protein [Bacteroidales bacterium]
TPLNSVIGFTDLLRTTPLNETQRNFVENANSSGHTLLGIINDILDFSKIGAGMLDIEPVKTDLITLLQNSINAIKPSAEKKNIQLLLSIDPDMPRFADIDPIRLKQVLANLLSNGVKFTEKGEVELKVRFNPLENKKGRLSFSIRDTGIGINDEEKNKLFKAFSQADSSTTRKYGGTGLGLILSDLITDKMGSKIQFISTPNIGTTFFFDIITTVHEDGDYLFQQNSDTFPPETRRLSVAETRRLSEAETLDQEGMDPKIRILIADDVKLNLVIVKAVLTRNIEQVEVFEASNGSEAVDLYKQHPIDLIVMDVMMPECDGLEATRQIREIESGTGNHTPIIALTAGALKEEREKCFAAGMDDFLAKPVDPEMTMAVIKRYLRL